MPLARLARLPPVVVLYFAVGWSYWRLNKQASPINCFVLAIAIFAWTVTFRETTWYADPTVTDMVWLFIERLAPSASVLLGAIAANLVANTSLNSAAGSAGTAELRR